MARRRRTLSLQFARKELEDTKILLAMHRAAVR
jgi:hypothetical protein